MIRFRSFMRGSFITCQSVCHMAFEYRRSYLTHLCFLDFTGESMTRPLDFIIWYTRE